MRIGEQARQRIEVAARVVVVRSLVIRGGVEVRLLFPGRELTQRLGEKVHVRRLRRDHVS
jgi:hypothetical protein